jgi:hypothetical protein
VGFEPTISVLERAKTVRKTPLSVKTLTPKIEGNRKSENVIHFPYFHISVTHKIKCEINLCHLLTKISFHDTLKQENISSIYTDKTDCDNYRGISLLSTSYNILWNILLSRLSTYVDEIIGDHQCGFRRNRSTSIQTFCLRQILEKKWEYNETVHQLFIDFKKAYDSVWREVVYNILIDFGVPMRLVRLIKMCLN